MAGGSQAVKADAFIGLKNIPSFAVGTFKTSHII
jgi:hypothetical protein